jgi:hypothetical protein
MGITPSGKDYLDLSGYSTWGRKVLRKLYDKGGSNAQHGVLYILENSIHITVGGGWQTLGGATGAWFDERSNTLLLNSDVSVGSVDSDGQATLWGLSLIIHEARHLEQGSNFSHSKLGEMDAWQIQIDVLVHLGYFRLDNTGRPINQWARDVMDAQTVTAFSAAVQRDNPKYWNRLYGSGYEQSLCIGLCSYPDLPYMCMMVYGPCPPEPPWQLRLDLTP